MVATVGIAASARSAVGSPAVSSARKTEESGGETEQTAQDVREGKIKSGKDGSQGRSQNTASVGEDTTISREGLGGSPRRREAGRGLSNRTTAHLS